MNKFLRVVSVVISALVLASLGHYFAPVSAGEPPLPQVALAVPSPIAIPTRDVSLPAKVLLVPPADVSVPEAVATVAAPAFEPYNSYLYIPTHAAERQPLQVVIALHGMGGEGKSFGAAMIKEAERNGWLLMAPTINYGDWHNPDVVANEEISTTQRLLASIDALPARTSLSIKPRVDVYGFSRGAQLAHRFAIFFPERVDHIVAFSAGTYTLPYGARPLPGNGGPDALPMPYGVSDLLVRLGHPINQARLRQVQFLIGVGGADTVAGDVPRQWDEYLGNTRLERAYEFTRAMQRSGMACSLKVYPAVGHEFTQPMLNTAVSFFTDPNPPVSSQLQ